MSLVKTKRVIAMSADRLWLDSFQRVLLCYYGFHNNKGNAYFCFFSRLLNFANEDCICKKKTWIKSFSGSLTAPVVCSPLEYIKMVCTFLITVNTSCMCFSFNWLPGSAKSGRVSRKSPLRQCWEEFSPRKLLFLAVNYHCYSRKLNWILSLSSYTRFLGMMKHILS